MVNHTHHKPRPLTCEQHNTCITAASNNVALLYSKLIAPSSDSPLSTVYGLIVDTVSLVPDIVSVAEIIEDM